MDTPELKTQNPKERKAAEAARDRLAELVFRWQPCSPQLVAMPSLCLDVLWTANTAPSTSNSFLAPYSTASRCVIRDGLLIRCRCGGFDKYGRLLGELFVDTWFRKAEKSVNELLVEEGHAYAYDGGTKLAYGEA